MKQSVLGAAGALVLVLVPATARSAAPAPDGVVSREVRETVTAGRTVSYHGDKLHIAVGKQRRRFVVTVTKAASCGFSRGNRGTSMRCARLREKKFMNKPVRIAWYFDAKKRRVASIVAVILSR